MNQKILLLTFSLLIFGQAQPAARMIRSESGLFQLTYGPKNAYGIRETDRKRGWFQLESGNSGFFMEADQETVKSVFKKYNGLNNDQKKAITSNAFEIIKTRPEPSNRMEVKIHRSFLAGALHLKFRSKHGLHNPVEAALLYFVLKDTELLEDLQNGAIQSLRAFPSLQIDTSFATEVAALPEPPSRSPVAWLGFRDNPKAKLAQFFIEKNMDRADSYTMINTRRNQRIAITLSPEEIKAKLEHFYSFDLCDRKTTITKARKLLQLSRTESPLNEVLHYGLLYLLSQYGSPVALAETPKVSTPSHTTELPLAIHVELQEVVFVKILEIVGI